jgi:molecular chaperone GrpE
MVVPTQPSSSGPAAPPFGETAGEAEPPAASARTQRGAAVPRAEAEEAGAATTSNSQVSDVEDQLKRVLADFDNLRKRLASEVAGARSKERAAVAAAFLPVLDNLELALSHAGSDPSLVQEGIEAVRDQAVAILATLGFVRFDPLAEQFDPVRHEAVSTAPGSSAAPGTIVHVVHPGYGDGEHQLRPAAVVVATKEI